MSSTETIRQYNLEDSRSMTDEAVILFMPSHLTMLQTLYEKDETSVNQNTWLMIRNYLNVRQELHSARTEARLFSGALKSAVDISNEPKNKQAKEESTKKPLKSSLRKRRRASPFEEVEQDCLETASWNLVTCMIKRKCEAAEVTAKRKSEPLNRLLESAKIEFANLKRSAEADKGFEKQPVAGLLSSANLFGSARPAQQKASLAKKREIEASLDVKSVRFNKAILWNRLINELETIVSRDNNEAGSN